MSKLVEIYHPVNCPYRSQRKCSMTKYGGDCMGNYFPKNCPLPNAPREGAPQKCPQDRCPKCGGLMIDITSGRQALYPQYVNDKTYACMVCHHREEGAHCADIEICPKCGSIGIMVHPGTDNIKKVYGCPQCSYKWAGLDAHCADRPKEEK